MAGRSRRPPRRCRPRLPGSYRRGRHRGRGGSGPRGPPGRGRASTASPRPPPPWMPPPERTGGSSEGSIVQTSRVATSGSASAGWASVAIRFEGVGLAGPSITAAALPPRVGSGGLGGMSVSPKGGPSRQLTKGIRGVGSGGLGGMSVSCGQVSLGTINSMSSIAKMGCPTRGCRNPAGATMGFRQFSLGTINVMTSITKMGCPSPGCGTEAGLMTGMTWFRGTGSSPTVPGPSDSRVRSSSRNGPRGRSGRDRRARGAWPRRAAGPLRGKLGAGWDVIEEAPGEGAPISRPNAPPTRGAWAIPRAPGARGSSPARDRSRPAAARTTHAPHPASAATPRGSGRRRTLIPLDERRGLAPQAAHLVGRVPGGPGVDPRRIVGRACRRAPCRRADSASATASRCRPSCTRASPRPL